MPGSVRASRNSHESGEIGQSDLGQLVHTEALDQLAGDVLPDLFVQLCQGLPDLHAEVFGHFGSRGRSGCGSVFHQIVLSGRLGGLLSLCGLLRVLLCPGALRRFLGPLGGLLGRFARGLDPHVGLELFQSVKSNCDFH